MQNEVALFEIKRLKREEKSILISFSNSSQIGRTVFEKSMFKDVFVFFCFYQNIDEVNEENWQNMLMNINFCQYFTNILGINLHTTFISQNFGLKRGKMFSYALEH